MAKTLRPGEVGLDMLASIYWKQTPARLDAGAKKAITASAKRIAEVAAGDQAVYGINTGFGKLASIQSNTPIVQVTSLSPPQLLRPF